MDKTLQAHIQLPADLGVAYALLPGDPARVERAKAFLEQPVDLVFNREYKSVMGNYQGTKVLVISSGIGGPSTAIAIEELAAIGIKGIIRIGSCGALQPGMKLGDLVIATAAVRDEGTSKAYVAPVYPAVADLSLLMIMKAITDHEEMPHRFGIVRSHDSFYTAREEALTTYWRGKGIVGSDMETAALFVLGGLKGMQVASILNVVVAPEGAPEEGVRRFVDGEELTRQGEQNQIALALETFRMLALQKEET
jgi:uridine phosphorylase